MSDTSPSRNRRRAASTGPRKAAQSEADLRADVTQDLGHTKLWQDYELSTKARARLRHANTALDELKETFSQAVTDEICAYREMFGAAATPAAVTSNDLIDRLVAAQRRLRASLDACAQNSIARQRLAQAIRPSPSPLRSLAGLHQVQHLVRDLEVALNPLDNPARHTEHQRPVAKRAAVQRWKRLALRLLKAVNEFDAGFRGLGVPARRRLSQNARAEYLVELLTIAHADSGRGRPLDVGSIKNWLGNQHKRPAKTARRL